MMILQHITLNEMAHVVKLCMATGTNSPIVCVVLALDSWNYCPREQAQQPNVCKIAQYSLYSWTVYIIIKK